MQKIRQVITFSKDHFLPGESKKAADNRLEERSVWLRQTAY